MVHITRPFKAHRSFSLDGIRKEVPEEISGLCFPAEKSAKSGLSFTCGYGSESLNRVESCLLILCPVGHEAFLSSVMTIYRITNIFIQASSSVSCVFSMFIVPSPFFHIACRKIISSLNFGNMRLECFYQIIH